MKHYQYFKTVEDVVAYYGSTENIPSKVMVVVGENEALFTTSNNFVSEEVPVAQGGYVASPEEEEKLADYDAAVAMSEDILFEGIEVCLLNSDGDEIDIEREKNIEDRYILSGFEVGGYYFIRIIKWLNGEIVEIDYTYIETETEPKKGLLRSLPAAELPLDTIVPLTVIPENVSYFTVPENTQTLAVYTNEEDGTVSIKAELR